VKKASLNLTTTAISTGCKIANITLVGLRNDNYTLHLTGLLSELFVPQQRQVCISNILPDDVEQYQQQWTDDQRYQPQHSHSLSYYELPSPISRPESCKTLGLIFLIAMSYEHKKLSYRTGTARRTMSVEIMSTATQLQEKSHLGTLAVDEWPWRSLKVIGIAAVW